MFPFMNTSMLRERFAIKDIDSEASSNKAAQRSPVIALGNRLTLPLKMGDGIISEHLIVRGHNMHSVARMAAKLFQDFNKTGPLLNRTPLYGWDEAWQSVTSNYEELYNPKNWISVYHKGRMIYKNGEYHPFLDIIEQCDATNREEYDEAVKIAEQAFLKAGRAVRIDKQTNIAAVIGVNNKKSRCGLVQRNPRRSTTFNFTLEPKLDEMTGKTMIADPHTCLNMCAAFLEGIQLSFTIGRLNLEIRHKQLSRTDPMTRQANAAQLRIGRLNGEIKGYRNLYETKFRPEQPDFMMIVEDTEESLRDLYITREQESE
jgi:hypothetical protein